MSDVTCGDCKWFVAYQLGNPRTSGACEFPLPLALKRDMETMRAHDPHNCPTHERAT